MAPTTKNRGIIMSKFVSTCCVCGTVYGVTTKNDGSDKERISHGYCGSKCKEFTPVQIMFYDKNIGCFNMDQGQQVDGVYYFHGEEVCRFILREENQAICINYHGTAYNEGIVVRTDNPTHMNKTIKEECKKWDMPAILL